MFMNYALVNLVKALKNDFIDLACQNVYELCSCKFSKGSEERFYRLGLSSSKLLRPRRSRNFKNRDSLRIFFPRSTVWALRHLGAADSATRF